MEWIRDPKEAERATLSKKFARLGFPGCAGSWDCSSWFWGFFPVGLRGQHSYKKKKRPNVRMEVVCDDFLRIWFLNFGAPDSKSDCQIFDQSSLFNRIRTAEWPPEHPDLPIGDNCILK